jgi:hypothetical protein
MSLARFYPRPGAVVPCELAQGCQLVASYVLDGRLACEFHFGAQLRAEMLDVRGDIPRSGGADGSGDVRFTIMAAASHLQTVRLLNLCTLYARRGPVAVRWPDGLRLEVWR